MGEAQEAQNEPAAQNTIKAQAQALSSTGIAEQCWQRYIISGCPCGLNLNSLGVPEHSGIFHADVPNVVKLCMARLHVCVQFPVFALWAWSLAC